MFASSDSDFKSPGTDVLLKSDATAVHIGSIDLLARHSLAEFRFGEHYRLVTRTRKWYEGAGGSDGAAINGDAELTQLRLSTGRL